MLIRDRRRHPDRVTPAGSHRMPTACHRVSSAIPFKVTRFSDENLVRVELLSQKQYPDRRTHKRRKPNKRKPQ